MAAWSQKSKEFTGLFSRSLQCVPSFPLPVCCLPASSTMASDKGLGSNDFWNNGTSCSCAVKLEEVIFNSGSRESRKPYDLFCLSSNEACWFLKQRDFLFLCSETGPSSLGVVYDFLSICANNWVRSEGLSSTWINRDRLDDRFEDIGLFFCSRKEGSCLFRLVGIHCLKDRCGVVSVRLSHGWVQLFDTCSWHATVSRIYDSLPNI